MYYIIQVCVRVRLSSVTCNKAKVGACANASPFSGDFLGDFRMSKLLDKSYSIQVLSKASMWEHAYLLAAQYLSK